MCFSSPNIPSPTAAPSSRAQAQEQELAVTSALARERAARAAAAGRKSTILTSPTGVTAPTAGIVGTKTMLGG